MDCTSDELIAAVRHAMTTGEVFLSARLREQVARRYVNSATGAGAGGDGDGVARGLEARLAAREIEVLRLIASGQSTKEIAVTLAVGTKTVETHRRRVMEKLNRHSVAELTQYAIVKGLIQLPREIQI
jgi:DNA-binding NarL/FixJ family response regulator